MGEVDSKKDEDARRVYGVLATSLDAALREVREALSEHAALLPEGRLGELDALLDEFSRRRVRIAFYGEVKAGKSTLLNALAGAEVSPMAFDPMTSLPVRITYGPETVWRLGAETLASLDAVAARMRAGGTGAAEITVETPADLLRLGGQVDLLDTPGVGSDDRADRISAAVLRALDAVVLVVRYPALFTRLTRQLMSELEGDIGKLFVVWNLDSDCAELSAEERARHAEQLRHDVAGAHELALVDARAGLRARLAGDDGAMAASGLDGFMSTLAAFASSDKREVAALREAAKRADAWMAEAHQALRERDDFLQAELHQARARLEKVAGAAAAECQAARDQFETFRRAGEAAAAQRRGAAQGRAMALRRALRAARRGWAWRGDVEGLQASLREMLEAYAASAAADGEEFRAALAQAARDFGAAFAGEQGEGAALALATLAPEERLARARQGRLQWLRRALWRRWYLPALSELEGDGVDTDLAAREQWAEKQSRRAEEEMNTVLAARLAESERRAAAESQRIEAETNFAAYDAEHRALEMHLPVLDSRRGGVNEISREARRLADA
jgi:hypothetical protein